MISVGNLNAHINSKDFDFIENETSDNSYDFVPDNHATDNIHRKRIPMDMEKFIRLVHLFTN